MFGKISLKSFFILVLWLGAAASHAKDIRTIIDSGDLNALEKYYAKGGSLSELLDIDYTHQEETETRYTVMHPMAYASAKNRPDMVAYFIGRKAEMEALGIWQNALSQAFILSLSTKNDSLIQALYDLNPSLEEKCESCRNNNALMVAAVYGLDHWYFKLKPQSDVNWVNENGCNLLHVAVAGGSTPIVKDVLSMKIHDLNAVASSRWLFTPLDYALMDSNETNFFLLIEAGADITAAPAAWYSAAIGENEALIQYITKHALSEYMFFTDQAGDMALQVAMSANLTAYSLDLMKRMIDYMREAETRPPADPNHFLENDIHALNYPIWEKNKEVYEAFIGFGVLMNEFYNDPYYVPMYHYLTKRAQKAFGKEYVAGVYTFWDIQEVD